MGFKCGIVGLFNVGKLIFFNVFIFVKVLVVNYLFVIKDFNVGMIIVLDLCLDKLVELVNLQKILLIMIEIVDIVGLIKGVSQGEGLGNQFFVNIREVDVIVYVV